MNDNKYRKGRGFVIGLALGIPLGMPIGLAMDNLAVGPAIGLAIGAGLGAFMEQSYRKREEVESPEQAKGKRNLRLIIFGILTAGMIALLVLYLFTRFNS